MASIKSFPNNADEYIGAEEVMRWLHGRTSGVFAAQNNAAVTAVQNSMAVTVSDGTGWIRNADGDGVVWWNDTEKVSGSKLQLAIAAADGVLNRIDRIIVEWKTTNYVDKPEIKVLKGTAASSPAAPALTNNSTVRQISLAQVKIPAGTTAITNLLITDERLNNSVCGLVTETVSADTSVINAQYIAALNQLESAISQAWSGEISDGTITRPKLAKSALYSPVNKPTATTYAVQDADVGKTIVDNYANRNSAVTWTISKAVLDAFNVGTELAFARTYNTVSVAITLAGARVINRESGRVGGASATVTFKLPEIGSMCALKKVEQDNSAGSFWILTGDVEVVS